MITRSRTGHVEQVRLAAPPLNLLGRAMIDALGQAFAALRDDPPRVVMLHCSGGGADVREMAELDEAGARSFISALHRSCAAIRDVDAPVIAFIDGPCVGAHLEVAAACDMRIATERSVLAMPEIKVGIPSVIDAWWITRICGLGAASGLFFDGEPIDAAEAFRIGLLNRIGSESDALMWAAGIARLSPVALAQQKRVLRDWTAGEYERAASASIERFAQTIAAGQAAVAMRAMLNKQQAAFE